MACLTLYADMYQESIKKQSIFLKSCQRTYIASNRPRVRNAECPLYNNWQITEVYLLCSRLIEDSHATEINLSRHHSVAIGHYSVSV